jgi:hypothetical protein
MIICYGKCLSFCLPKILKETVGMEKVSYGNQVLVQTWKPQQELSDVPCVV